MPAPGANPHTATKPNINHPPLHRLLACWGAPVPTACLLSRLPDRPARSAEVGLEGVPLESLSAVGESLKRTDLPCCPSRARLEPGLPGEVGVMLPADALLPREGLRGRLPREGLRVRPDVLEMEGRRDPRPDPRGEEAGLEGCRTLLPRGVRLRGGEPVKDGRPLRMGLLVVAAERLIRRDVPTP